MLKRFILLFVLWPVIGHSAHITDKLLADMYSKPSSSEELLKQLPSGTPVELIVEKGSFVQIRLVNGETGWVEKKFLSEDKPAEVKLLILQGKYRQAQKKLDLVEKKLVGAEALALKKETESLELLNATKVGFQTGIEKALKKILGLREALSQKKKLEKSKPKLAVIASEPLTQQDSIALDRVRAISFLMLVVGALAGIFWGVFIQKRRHLKRYGEFKRKLK